MLDQNLAREVLACAVRTGGDFAEIFMEDRVDHALLMRSGRIENVNTGRIHGAGIRVFNGTNAIWRVDAKCAEKYTYTAIAAIATI